MSTRMIPKKTTKKVIILFFQKLFAAFKSINKKATPKNFKADKHKIIIPAYGVRILVIVPTVIVNKSNRIQVIAMRLSILKK